MSQRAELKYCQEIQSLMHGFMLTISNSIQMQNRVLDKANLWQLGMDVVNFKYQIQSSLALSIFMRQQLENVNSFYTIKLNQLVINPELINIQAFIKELHTHLFNFSYNKALTIQYNDRSNMQKIYSDYKLLFSIVLNILMFHLQYSEKGDFVFTFEKSQEESKIKFII